MPPLLFARLAAFPHLPTLLVAVDRRDYLKLHLREFLRVFKPAAKYSKRTILRLRAIRTQKRPGWTLRITIITPTGCRRCCFFVLWGDSNPKTQKMIMNKPSVTRTSFVRLFGTFIEFTRSLTVVASFLTFSSRLLFAAWTSLVTTVKEVCAIRLSSSCFFVSSNRLRRSRIVLTCSSCRASKSSKRATNCIKLKDWTKNHS